MDNSDIYIALKKSMNNNDKHEEKPKEVKKSFFSFLKFFKKSKKEPKKDSPKVKREIPNKNEKKKTPKKIGIKHMLILLILIIASLLTFKFVIGPALKGKQAIQNQKTFSQTAKKQETTTQKTFATAEEPVVTPSAQEPKVNVDDGKTMKETPSKTNEQIEKQLFEKYCQTNIPVLLNNIEFILDREYAFSYLGKKYKMGDVFKGLSRDLIIKEVYFKNSNERFITFADAKNNLCSVSVPWDKGLKIKIFFDAIDVTENLTGNTETYLVGDVFSFVRIKTINETGAELETPAGTLFYKAN